MENQLTSLSDLTDINGNVINSEFQTYDSQAHNNMPLTYVNKRICGSSLSLKERVDKKGTPAIFFENCHFDDGLTFLATRFEGNIKFENCTFKFSVNLEDSSFDNGFEFRNCKIGTILLVNNSHFKNFFIELDCPSIGIYGSRLNQCAIYSNDYFKVPREIGSITIDFRNTFGLIDITNVNVNKLEFYNNISKETELLIKEMKFNQLTFRELSNNGRIKLIGLEPWGNRPAFAILNCNIGKTEFISLDFRLLKFLNFKAVYLIESIFVNVVWPERLDLSPYPGQTTYLLDQKETCRQLKNAYSKQGDSVLEYKFHGLEMEKYREYLDEVLKSEYVDKSRRWVLLQTRFVLWLSEYTSDFGQSLWRPIRTILLTGVPFFMVLIACGGIKELNTEFNFSLPRVSITLGQFFHFLNPLRRYDPKEINAVILLDMLMRIITSYCLFNFLRATRRFVK